MKTRTYQQLQQTAQQVHRSPERSGLPSSPQLQLIIDSAELQWPVMSCRGRRQHKTVCWGEPKFNSSRGGKFWKQLIFTFPGNNKDVLHVFISKKWNEKKLVSVSAGSKTLVQIIDQRNEWVMTLTAALNDLIISVYWYLYLHPLILCVLQRLHNKTILLFDNFLSIS